MSASLWEIIVTEKQTNSNDYHINATRFSAIPFKDLSIRIDSIALSDDDFPIKLTRDYSMLPERIKAEFNHREHPDGLEILPKSWMRTIPRLKKILKQHVDALKEKHPEFFNYNFNIEYDGVPLRCNYSLSLTENTIEGEGDGLIKSTPHEIVIVRRGKETVPNLDDLLMPEFIKYRLKACIDRLGLILVVGGTGSGKSTTLAALQKYRLEQRGGRLVEIGDPIEFPLRKAFPSTHPYAEAIQKEVTSYEEIKEEAKGVLRQAPNICAFTEVRDGDLADIVLNLANSGHFTTTTLHASGTKQGITRFAQICKEKLGDMAYSLLSDCIQLILYQYRADDGTIRFKIFDMGLLNTPESQQEQVARINIADGNFTSWDGNWGDVMRKAWINFNKERNLPLDEIQERPTALKEERVPNTSHRTGNQARSSTGGGRPTHQPPRDQKKKNLLDSMGKVFK